MKFGSVCSGIEAASVAWEPLGWRAAWLSEIEPFPSAVLSHHWPEVPNLGDMTQLARRVLVGEIEAPDVLVGGTPCQAFSVAGLREGLADERGQLTIKFVELINAIDTVRERDGKPPVVVVWENVPGVFSSRDNAFGCFAGALAGENCELEPPGKRWANAGCVYGPQRTAAWRILDAQYFGVAQRRRRVFVIASSRTDFDPVSILFEREGVRRDTAPSRETCETVAALTASGVGTCGADDNQGQAGHLQPAVGPLPVLSSGQANAELSDNLPPALNCNRDGAPIAFQTNATADQAASAGRDIAPTMASCPGGHPSIAFDTTQIASPHNRSNPQPGDACHPLSAGAHPPAIAGTQVRRLTPVECERLQGFPDGHTQIAWRNKHPEDCPDSHRYKALGNSMAVPVMRWIGERIAQATRQ